jgi:UDP-N-acetylglucosamine 4-epimerase
MKTVLITGGCGFIGSHIVDFMLQKNFKVKIIDNLSTGFKKNVEHHKDNENVEIHYDDICDIDKLRIIMKDVDMVCHQAALGSVPRSIEDPLKSHNSNVNGFLNILIVCKEYNIKRIVYASSSSVYGDNERLPKQEEIVGEVLSPYAATKKIDEIYAKVFGKCYGLETIGLRYFNVYGARQNPNGVYAAVIPKFIDKIKNNERVEINGDGEYSRDFTYIKNVVYANYLALTTENQKTFNNVYNIGAGGRIKIIEMYNIIKDILNSDLQPIFKEIRKGDIPHSNADISKAKKDLNYIPLYDFKQGIYEYINNL